MAPSLAYWQLAFHSFGLKNLEESRTGASGLWYLGECYGAVRGSRPASQREKLW